MSQQRIVIVGNSAASLAALEAIRRVDGASPVTLVADEAIPADFARRTWTSSEDPKGNYRVWIVIKWYEYGSSTVTDGKVVEELDYYRTIRGNGVEQGYRQNSCYKAFN